MRKQFLRVAINKLFNSIYECSLASLVSIRPFVRLYVRPNRLLYLQKILVPFLFLANDDDDHHHHPLPSVTMEI